MQQSPSGRKLKTITTALNILEFIKKEGDVGLSDVTDQLNIPKSTAHGYLSTLEDTGLVMKKNQRYVLGLRLMHFGEQAKQRDNLYPLAEPKVDKLANQLSESADFMTEENGRLISIYNNGQSIKDPNFQVGRYFYMHNSAGGKAVLAEHTDDQVEAIVDKWGLPAATNQTITDKDKLLDEVRQVRREGFATTDEELVEGLRSVGVAIKRPDGTILGALGIGGPTYRIDDDRLYHQIPNVLLEVADELENEIAQAIKESQTHSILPD